MCHLYFQDSFDNFILNESKIPLLNIKDGIIEKDNFVIFENSLSKRDIGFYDKTKIDWINSLNIKLNTFEDYQYQIDILISFFVLFTLVHISIFSYLIYKKRKLKNEMKGG